MTFAHIHIVLVLDSVMTQGACRGLGKGVGGRRGQTTPFFSGAILYSPYVKC